MVYLYRCKNCHKPFARPMQGVFMAGECDYIQAAPAADNAALAARVRGLGQALAFWPKAARLLAEVATRLEAIQVKVDPAAPGGDQTGKFWFNAEGPFGSGGYAWARRNGKTTFQEEAMRAHRETRGSFHDEFVSRREAEEAMRRHARAYGSEEFAKVAEAMKRMHTKADVPLSMEELDAMYGKAKRKTKPEQPYYRQNQRY